MAKLAVRSEDQLVVNVMGLVTCSFMAADGEPTGVEEAQVAMAAVLLEAALRR